MARIRIRKYKRNPDFYEVVGYGNIIRTKSKREAKDIANAKRRVRQKHRRRKKR